MQYDKPALSISNQIIKLQERGLIIENEKLAESYLINISYYRLRAYTYPFQDNDDPDHPFKFDDLTFEQIIGLYEFDHKLRLLVFDGLEKIEIALRTQIIYQWALTNGSHWQLNTNLFRDLTEYQRNIDSLEIEISRSKEKFIEHYGNKYTSPNSPPAWMSLEVISFGLLSQIFKNLKKGNEKIAVTEYFGLNDISILENWMQCFSNIRNICAHHSRLLNRRLTALIKLPTHPRKDFIKNKEIYQYKLYASLSCMDYMLRIINPKYELKGRLKSLMDTCPLKQDKEMGFPQAWREEKFWQ